MALEVILLQRCTLLLSSHRPEMRKDKRQIVTYLPVTLSCSNSEPSHTLSELTLRNYFQPKSHADYFLVTCCLITRQLHYIPYHDCSKAMDIGTFSGLTLAYLKFWFIWDIAASHWVNVAQILGTVVWFIFRGHHWTFDCRRLDHKPIPKRRASITQ